MYGHIYTPKERDFIRTFAPGHTYKEIVDEYNNRFQPEITAGRVKGYLANNKITMGTTGRFQKGQVPANKGTHNGGWEPTQFKKGHVPALTKPVGTETVRADGYIWVKIAEPNKWREKHRIVWEEHYGRIVKGKCVIFLNGDRTDVRIENFMLVDLKINARMNQLGLRFTDADSTKAAIAVAELTSAIGDAKRKRCGN